MACVDEREDGEEEEEEMLLSSDSEIGDALDFLDAKDDSEPEESFSLSSRGPNAHGGPLSNSNQKYSSRIRAVPLEEWEGRFNVGMSNSVTTAIRDGVRDLAIGKMRTTVRLLSRPLIREIVWSCLKC